MPNRFNNWTFTEARKFLMKKGFVFYRSRGSHFYYKKEFRKKNRVVCLPQHGNKSIKTGTMKSIIRQSSISEKDWLKK